MNRVQALRFSITGQRPTIGTRQPGELYVNWADNALGTIDNGLNPVDLVAVRYWNVLANYSAGSYVIYSGAMYYALVPVTAGAFNPAQWAAVSAGSGGVPEAPTDGRAYARDGQTASWVASPPEAPTDGQLYGRQSATWVVVPSGGGGGIPDSPNDGTTYGRRTTSGSGAWVHLTHADITDWAAGGYLALSGGSMTGQLNTLAPGAGSNAANKTYVDNAIAAIGTSAVNANRLDNGNMLVNQRALASAPVTAGASIYAVDRWWVYASRALVTTGQNYNGLGLPAGYKYMTGVQCTSNSAPVASDAFVIGQGIESGNLIDIIYGAGLQPITLSFWACASGSGVTFPATFSGSISNGVQNRAYIFTFALTTSGAWQHFIITIPGDPSGTWTTTLDTDAGMYVQFDLGSGATYRTATANAWVSGTYFGLTTAARIMGHSGAKLAVTGVKLELGGSATPFIPDSLSINMEKCQRHLIFNTFSIGTSYCPAGGDVLGSFWNPVYMRLPAYTTTLSSLTYFNASTASIGYADETLCVIQATASATGEAAVDGAVLLSAEL